MAERLFSPTTADSSLPHSLRESPWMPRAGSKRREGG